MIKSRKNIRVSVIFISIWTILQTLFHAFCISISYLLSICKIRPEFYDTVFLYLTYFYKKTCGIINLKNESFLLKKWKNNKFSNQIQFLEDENYSKELFNFINTTLNHGNWPEQSNSVSRTELYLILLLIADLIWIISAIGLIVNSCLNKSHYKYSIIIIYGTWLFCCAFISFLDVVSSVQYGIDLIQIRSYTTWLEFVGVKNYKEFEDFDKLNSSKVFPFMPTTVIVSLLSRFFFIWLINIFCFFTILFTAFEHYEEKPINNRRIIKRTFSNNNNNNISASRSTYYGNSRTTFFTTANSEDLNSTSEERIKSWQKFYGAVDANSTMTTNSTNSHNQKNSNLNSSKGNKSLSVHYDNEISIINDNPGEIGEIGYYKYPDVASPLPECSHQNNRKSSILKPNNKPWSYLYPTEEYPKLNNPKVEKREKVQCTKL